MKCCELPNSFCFRLKLDDSTLKAGNSFSVIYYGSENLKEGITLVLINECLLMQLKIRIGNEDRN
jgi:hypothetical protein